MIDVIVTPSGNATVVTVDGIAGQVTYAVRFADGTKVAVVGSVYGAPGPVTMIIGGMQVRVDMPSRFGMKFDLQWVERYIIERESMAAARIAQEMGLS